MANAFPYRLYGGALRPDAITGLNPGFAQALLNLYTSAPPEVQRELGLNSAYRSPAVQAKLYAASDKSGRRVAPPGKSRHQFGEAADLYGFGLSKDQVSQATKDWVTQNAPRFGLGFPVRGEPWHIQLMRSSGQAGPGAIGPPPGSGIEVPPVLPDLLANNVAAPGESSSFPGAEISRSRLKSGDTGGGSLVQGPGASFNPETYVSPETPPSTPGQLPGGQNSPGIMSPLPGLDLASLFQVKDIGQAAVTNPPRFPGRRF
jgi:hypothetical protein